MSNAPTHPFELTRDGASAPKFDIYIIPPVLAFAYVEIVAPLLTHIDTGPLVGGMWTRAQHEIMMAPRLDNRIFWPLMALISTVWTLRNWSRLVIPHHIVCLFMYLALAGVSVLWAYKPEVSSIRYFQQVMIIISMVLPALLAARSADILLGVFLCFALASVINLFFVVDQNPLILENGRICYAGYFTWKGVLGECAAISILLALYEILQPGWRRIFAIMVIGVATYLVVMSDSKGSLAIALPAPLLAGLIAVIAKKTRVSPAILVLPIPIFYTVLSYAVSGLINRISWYLYGNYTLSGRTIIWDFAKSEIARKPLLGWGYQSFWNIGPDGPSILDAPGWVKDMPSAHSGYLDTQLEMGYVGLVFLVVFIFATLHAIGRVVARDPARAWLLLTIAFYVILTNFIEAGWMRGSEMLWVLFVIVAAEAGRYWQPYPAGMPKPVRGRPVIARRRPDIARVQGSSKLGNLQKRRR